MQGNKSHTLNLHWPGVWPGDDISLSLVMRESTLPVSSDLTPNSARSFLVNVNSATIVICNSHVDTSN